MSTDRLQHTLAFADTATPTRRAKPAGVTGCEVYLFVGDDTPQSPNRYTFNMLSTRTPQRIEFTDEDVGRYCYSTSSKQFPTAKPHRLAERQPVPPEANNESNFRRTSLQFQCRLNATSPAEGG